MKYIIQVSAIITTSMDNQMNLHLAAGIIEKDNMDEAEAVAASLYNPFSRYADESIGYYDDLCVDVAPLDEFIKNMEGAFEPYGFISAIIRESSEDKIREDDDE